MTERLDFQDSFVKNRIIAVDVRPVFGLGQVVDGQELVVGRVYHHHYSLPRDTGPAWIFSIKFAGADNGKLMFEDTNNGSSPSLTAFSPEDLSLAQSVKGKWSSNSWLEDPLPGEC